VGTFPIAREHLGKVWISLKSKEDEVIICPAPLDSNLRVAPIETTIRSDSAKARSQLTELEVGLFYSWHFIGRKFIQVKASSCSYCSMPV